MTEQPPELADVSAEEPAEDRPRRRSVWFALVGLLVALTLVVGPLALFRQADVVEAGPRVIATSEEGSQDRDLQPKGASLGDEFLLTQTLTEGGTEIGTGDITCTYVRVVPAPKGKTPLAVSVQCVGIARIGADTLTYQGLNTFAPGGVAVSRFAVTGGTGAFRAATGELRVTETGKGTSTIALDLTRDQN